MVYLFDRIYSDVFYMPHKINIKLCHLLVKKNKTLCQVAKMILTYPPITL